MRLLLDTHVFLWWLIDSPRLSDPARQAIAIETNEVLVSAATAWEIATKHRLGRLPDVEPVALDIAGTIANQNFEQLTITVADAARAGALPGPHRDPFDRMLVAQALSGNLALVSIDSVMDQYGVRRLW